MEEQVIDQVIINSREQQKWVQQFTKKRSLFHELLKIDNEYYVGIKGIRGIGKTVLLLQIAEGIENSVYFSADSTVVKSFSLYEIGRELYKRGFKTLFIDEIHRKANWDEDIKTLYDEHQIRVIFSGSSALDMTKTGADLSRRVVLKELLPISLREFLNIKKKYEIPLLSFTDILKRKQELVEKYAEAHGYLEEYYQYGGVLYPVNGFFDALENSLRKVILNDLSTLRDVNVKYEADVYKLLKFIAQSPPFETNYSKIAHRLEISKTLAIRLVHDLEASGLIISILPCKKKGVDVKKEPKIYLTMPLRRFFGKQGIEINRGALREEFFVNHLRELCYLKASRGEKTPDFRYKNIIIEVGGEGKKMYQNPDYIAVDGLSTQDNKVPLFLFGFVY